MEQSIKSKFLSIAANVADVIDFDGIVEYCENDTWYGAKFKYETGGWERNNLINTEGLILTEHEYNSNWVTFKVVISKNDTSLFKIIKDNR